MKTKHLSLILLAILLSLFCLLFTACGEDATTAPGTSGAPDTTSGGTASTTDSSVYTQISVGELSLKEVTLVLDTKNELSQVKRAADDLAADFKAVTGKEPAIASSSSKGTAIYIGTLGESELIDRLAASQGISANKVAGNWEGFHIGVYEDGDSHNRFILIAGADKRGTIYGIYTLSELIGVSPWYFWGDVPIKENKNLTLSAETLTRNEAPDVKYRGIFINDEENFTFWSERFENALTSPGSPNPETYKKVFELILRLKANTLWPAMHNLSDAFNKEINPKTGIAYNAELADAYGVVMGSSHCELMLCNNETEWAPWCEANKGKYNLTKINNDWKASYDYTVNAEAMNAYWEARVAANYRFDNIYTIGLRGVHDAEILCSQLSDKSWASKATVVQAAVEAQLAILEKYEQLRSQELGHEVKFATCYAVYKEAAEYYKYDLSLPESCIILFCDDNYGYIRQMPSQTEIDTYEGFGVYYHVSYYGVPRSYLWIDTMPLANIYAEMDKAYTAGEDDLWILNVGDLKPAEISIDFFMDLAWNEAFVKRDGLNDYLKAFFQKTFSISNADAEALAVTMNEFYQLAFAYKPEYQGYHEGPDFSAIYVGDEAERMINRLEEIVLLSLKIAKTLPENEQASYQEIVHYKFFATYLTLQKTVYEQKNALYLSQGRFQSVNVYAALSEAAYRAVLQSVEDYCNLSDGKWQGIMNPYQTAQWLPVIAGAPKVTYLPESVAEDGVGAAVEGQSGNAPIDLYFDSLSLDCRFIDIFSLGKDSYDYKITASDKIKLATDKGSTLALTNGMYTDTVTIEKRLYIAIDWTRVTAVNSTETLTVSDKYGHTITYTLHLHKSALDPDADKAAGILGHYETNGIIAIEAEHYADKKDVDGMSWVEIPYLGYTGSSMKTFPDISSGVFRLDADYENSSPYLEYRFYVQKTGSYSGTFYRIPTLNEGNDDAGVHKTCRVAYAIDGGEVQLFRGNSVVDTAGNSTWSNSIRTNMERMPFTANFTSTGWHTIRIYRADAGITFDKIVMIHSSLANTSRLGESESVNNIAYTPRTNTYLPDFSDVTIKYGEALGSTLLFDFTAKPENTQEGYTAVDLSSQGVSTKRYEWTEGFDSLSAYYRNKGKTAPRDLGVIVSSTKATFVASTSAPGKYIVTLAIGDMQSNGTPISNMSVKANGKTVIEGLDHPQNQTSELAFVVESTDGDITLTFAGTWAIAAVEIRPYVEIAAPTEEVITTNKNGDIVIEAEWALLDRPFAGNTKTTDGKAYFMETGGIYGSAVYFGPNREGSYPTPASSAKLTYQIKAESSGSYNVFAYVKSEDDDDDSLNIALDSSATQLTNDFKHTGGSYVLKKIGTVILSEGKVSTLTVYGREDGLAIDRIVLTKKAAWSE